MSTSEMVSKLSTCTSTPTGIGGPEIQMENQRWLHLLCWCVLLERGNKSNNRDHVLTVSYSCFYNNKSLVSL